MDEPQMETGDTELGGSTQTATRARDETPAPLAPQAGASPGIPRRAARRASTPRRSARDTQARVHFAPLASIVAALTCAICALVYLGNDSGTGATTAQPIATNPLVLTPPFIPPLELASNNRVAGDETALAGTSNNEGGATTFGFVDPFASNGAELPAWTAILKGGEIVIEGAVPDQEAADAIVALASEVLGTENVTNNYVIDERAGDPNLGDIRVDDTVLFETGSAVISAEFEPLLEQTFTLMTISPAMIMTVVGHTDDIGTNSYNQALSLSRATAVIDWLDARCIDAARLKADGLRETEPVGTNETAEGRQLNRRIHILIDKLLSD